jgi:uncharacterized protein (TIGR03382 family)
MTDQLRLASGYTLAPTSTTTDHSLTIYVPSNYTYPGNVWTTITNTLSVYGPGTGTVTPVISTITGVSVTTGGTPTFTQIATAWVFPNTFLSRGGEHYDRTPSSKGVSSASAAGIGIGSAILSALIALLFAWLLYRRRPKHHRRGVQSEPISRSEPKDLESTQSNDAILLAPVQDILPQPRPHSAITAEMSQLGTRIKNHAANFYTRRTEDIRMLELEEDVLQGMGLDQQNCAKLLGMLASADGREEAIRYIIAQKVFACIQIPGNPKTSFLPSHIVALHKNMSSALTGNGKSSLLFTDMNIHLTISIQASQCSKANGASQLPA